MLHFDESDYSCIDNCLLTRMLAGLCIGIVFTSADGKIVWLNREAARCLGAEPKHCIGKALPTIIKDIQLAAFWQEAEEQADNTFGEVTIQWPAQRILKLNATRYADDSGRILGRALLFCDVSNERQVQVKLSEDVANRLLELTGGHMPPKPFANLTQQEVRMLRMVGRGMGNDEIADEACISSSTVRSHLKSIYRKLGLASRAEAVAYAARNHLV